MSCTQFAPIRPATCAVLIGTPLISAQQRFVVCCALQIGQQYATIQRYCCLPWLCYECVVLVCLWFRYKWGGLARGDHASTDNRSSSSSGMLLANWMHTEMWIGAFVFCRDFISEYNIRFGGSIWSSRVCVRKCCAYRYRLLVTPENETKSTPTTTTTTAKPRLRWQSHKQITISNQQTHHIRCEIVAHTQFVQHAISCWRISVVLAYSVCKNDCWLSVTFCFCFVVVDKNTTKTTISLV